MILVRTIVRIMDFENTKAVKAPEKFMGMIFDKALTYVSLLLIAIINYESI